MIKTPRLSPAKFNDTQIAILDEIDVAVQDINQSLREASGTTSRERCSCDDFADDPCPRHTACKICGEPARYYAEDDVTPLCAECAA